MPIVNCIQITTRNNYVFHIHRKREPASSENRSTTVSHITEVWKLQQKNRTPTFICRHNKRVWWPLHSMPLNNPTNPNALSLPTNLILSVEPRMQLAPTKRFCTKIEFVWGNNQYILDNKNSTHVHLPLSSPWLFKSSQLAPLGPNTMSRKGKTMPLSNLSNVLRLNAIHMVS